MEYSQNVSIIKPYLVIENTNLEFNSLHAISASFLYRRREVRITCHYLHDLLIFVEKLNISSNYIIEPCSICSVILWSRVEL